MSSHGSTSGDKCEPNLIPLLDLVLQLVMFFLAVARIDNEMRDQSVVLPQASIARSLTKDYNKIVIVNLYPAPLSEDDKGADPNARRDKVRYSLFEGYGVREYTSLVALKDALKSKFEIDQKATPEGITQAREELHLDKGFLEQYVIWLGDVVHGDLGTSFFDHEPVSESIAQRFPITLSLALGAMVLTVLLDAIENHHIMTMVHSIQNALPLSPSDGELQMIASQVKFHASYFAVFLFSFGFLQFGRLGRVIAVLLWLYIPCGVLISVVPVESARLLVLGRTIFFIFAFILSAILFFSRPKTSAQPAH